MNLLGSPRSDSWTVAGLLTRWMTVTTTVLIVGLSIACFVFLRESVARELESLTLEEVHELRALFSATERTPEDFQRIAAELGAEHPATPMGWRVWAGPDGEIWAELGRSELLDTMPQTLAAGSSGRLEPLDPAGKSKATLPYLHLRLGELDDDLLVGLALDGGEKLGLLRRYGLALIGFVVAGLLVSFLAGRWLATRLSAELRTVAARLRDLDNPNSAHGFVRTTAPEEIREVASALEERLASLRRQQDRAKLLTAGLAHELRSPVQNMLGKNEVALMRQRSVPEYVEVLESQIEELRDLSRVVDNLVVLSSPYPEVGGRVDGAAQSLGVERFDLGAELELRLGRDRASAARRGIEINLQCAGDLNMEGDREAVLLAMSNVVGNAVRWSPDGGVVTVSAVHQPDVIVVTVDDQGPGVSEELREAIFEPFFQGPADGRQRLGYGLGLALVRAAIEAHGGRIQVSSSPSGGARFAVELRSRAAVTDLSARA